MNHNDRSEAPNVTHLIPNVKIKNVQACLELSEVRAFECLHLIRLEQKRRLRAENNLKYFQILDKRLRRCQEVLLDLLHESKAAAKYSNLAIDGAIAVVTGAAKI